MQEQLQSRLNRLQQEHQFHIQQATTHEEQARAHRAEAIKREGAWNELQAMFQEIAQEAGQPPEGPPPTLESVAGEGKTEEPTVEPTPLHHPKRKRTVRP